MNRDTLLQSIYRQVKHRPIRDMAWALLHPCLFTELPNAAYRTASSPSDAFLCDECLTVDWLDNDLEEWLLALDQQPEGLFAHLAEQRATRLGIYFEQLLSFYFSTYPRFNLLAKNLQVNNTERTMGEFDFIVLDKGENYRHVSQGDDTSRYLHIEVAIKFYVGIPNGELTINNNIPTYNWHRWVGPNKKDTLAIKMNHLLQRQLRLSQCVEGIEALQQAQINVQDIIPKLLLTGCLYTPANERSAAPNTSIFTPEYISKHVDLSSQWYELDTFLSAPFHQNNQHSYIILPRQQWMSPLHRHDIDTLDLTILDNKQCLEKIRQSFNESNVPLHIAEVNMLQDNCIIEVQRFFILPE